jgi:hypothetical protein
MPTLSEVAEWLAETYWRLLDRNDPTLEGTLDALFAVVADLNASTEGIERSPNARRFPHGAESRTLAE